MAQTLPRAARHDLTFEIVAAADKLRLVTCLLWARRWRCGCWMQPAPCRIACAVVADGMGSIQLERVPAGAYAALLLELAAPDDAPSLSVLGVEVMTGRASNGVPLGDALRDPTPATFLLVDAVRQRIDLRDPRPTHGRDLVSATRGAPWRSI